MWKNWAVIAVGAAIVLAGCSSTSESRVVVGAGTTLIDSQFMAEIAAAYAEVEPSTDLSIVALSSAQAISVAEAGDADVIITHNREALDEFLDEHPESIRSDVFASEFFIVAAPSVAFTAGSIEEALTEIAVRSLPFMSRDDGSGTNAAELTAWQSAGIDPSGEPWYFRTGTGMGSTLQVTDQRHAITLTEHGSFLASESTLSVVRVENTAMDNPYDLTVVDPTDSPAASTFSVWLTSSDGAVAITNANQKLFGQQVYEAR
jgi:tungstate transport system substrate-binding protein